MRLLRKFMLDDDEEPWKARFAERRYVICRMAREALDEDARDETLPLRSVLMQFVSWPA